MKLLGDGAMLRLGDATVGVEAALDLVEAVTDEGALSPHAGINAGPVIERDLDVFGQTVNLASRIADVAGPGEVLASEAVVEAAADDRFGFERIEDARLEGLQSPVALYRVSRSARPFVYSDTPPEVKGPPCCSPPFAVHGAPPPPAASCSHSLNRDHFLGPVILQSGWPIQPSDAAAGC